jgi:CRISPR-associated protein Cmr1
MMRVELTLKTVTPLFLGGADQQPELRPASVRGALRFWLRAALGGVIGDADLDHLHYLEANVFGEMERGSTVVVRLSHSGFSKSEEPLLPHRTGGQAGIVKAVPVGTPFNLILNLRPCAGSQLLEIATWTALLWLTLGGIGRRSRRRQRADSSSGHSPRRVFRRSQKVLERRYNNSDRRTSVG